MNDDRLTGYATENVRPLVDDDYRELNEVIAAVALLAEPLAVTLQECE